MQLAPEKKSIVIEETMSQIAVRKDEADEERKKSSLAPRFAAAGQSTQMVVGATTATDRQILTTATHLYQKHKLRRIYYTGFSPYPEADARLPLKASPMMREHRLYQSDWLMRFYGFSAGELTSEENPSLSLTEDPKAVWARTHPEYFPVDVNAAPREALLRVPGIGYRNAERILRIRRYHSLLVEDLRKLNIRIKSALPYLVAVDHLPSSVPRGKHSNDEPASGTTAQMDLFAPLSALSGVL